VVKRIIFIGALVGLAALIAFGYREATRDPIIHTATFKASRESRSGLPVRVLLMSDPHVEGPETSPDRLSRIVDQINVLHPDIVVIAGDFLGDSPLATKRYTIEQAVEPLRRLKPALGVFAVPGNHDRPYVAELGDALQSVGVTLLDDDAVQVGPIALGGFRPGYYDSLRRLYRLDGTRILVAHSPDQFPKLKRAIPLMLAGHTHCGQIVLPVVGALATGSHYGTRYFCGLIEDQGKTLIVTSGLGTSIIPVRIGAPPDMWLITIE
jgi:predicted MPP superfamily phosphohydrolase